MATQTLILAEKPSVGRDIAAAATASQVKGVSGLANPDAS